MGKNPIGDRGVEVSKALLGDALPFPENPLGMSEIGRRGFSGGRRTGSLRFETHFGWRLVLAQAFE